MNAKHPRLLRVSFKVIGGVNNFEIKYQDKNSDQKVSFPFY